MYDTIFIAIDANIAPLIWLFKSILCLDMNLYMHKKTINAIIKMAIRVIISEDML